MSVANEPACTRCGEIHTPRPTCFPCLQFLTGKARAQGRQDGVREIVDETILYIRTGCLGITGNEDVDSMLKYVRSLRYLADGCPEHPSYRAKRVPTVTVRVPTCNCHRMWAARQVITGDGPV